MAENEHTPPTGEGKGDAFDWNSLADSIEAQGKRISGFSSSLEAVLYAVRAGVDAPHSREEMLKMIDFFAVEIAFAAKSLHVIVDAALRRLGAESD